MSNSAFQPTVLTVPASGSSTGQGELNIVTNSIAAADTTGWTNASRSTGGGPLSPTIGTYFTVTAANSAEGSTSGAYASLTLPSSLQNKKLKVEFYYTSFDDVYYLSVRKGGVRVPLSTDSAGATALPINSTGKFVAYFDTDNSGSWTVHLTRVTGSGSSLQFTNVVVGPGIQPQGAVVGSDVDYGAITINGSTTNPTKGTTTRDKFFVRRVGEYAEIRLEYAQTTAGTAGSGYYIVRMPTGLTINTALVNASGTTGSNTVGTAQAYASATTTLGEVQASANNSLIVRLYNDTINNDWGSTALSLANTNLFFSADIRVPIAEWAGSGTVQLAQNDVSFASDDGTNDIFGPAGTTVPSITLGPGVTQRSFTFPESLQQQDSFVVEFQFGAGEAWYPAEYHFPYIQTAANDVYGITCYQSGNSILVGFGNRGGRPSGGIGNNGLAWTTTWRWRVRKSSAGAAVGYGIVAKDQSGLLPAYNTNLDDATATRLGLKQYLHGTSYNGGNAPTVTSSQAGFSVNRAVFVPYQTQDGAWRLKFNITAAFTNATITSNLTTIAGTVFKSTTNNYQPVFGMPIGNALGIYQAYVSPSTGALTLITPSTPGVTGVAYSGDVELDSKPTWAYS